MKTLCTLALMIVACVASSPASAADAAPAREVDFSVVLHDSNGKVATDCAEINPKDRNDCKKIIDLTLSSAVRSALNIPEQGLTPEKITDRGVLARKINTSLTFAPSATEIELMKSQLAKAAAFIPLSVIFEAIELLDPASAKK